MRIALPLIRLPRRRLGVSFLGLLALARSRNALASLSADQLRDVGIDATEARTEAARPVWDAPAAWRD